MKVNLFSENKHKIILVLTLCIITTLLLTNEYISTINPIFQSQQLTRSTRPISSHIIRNDEIQFTNHYFRATDVHPPLLTLHTELNSTTLLLINNWVLKTTRETFLENQLKAKEKYSIKPIEENLSYIGSWTILESKYELVGSGTYFIAFSMMDENTTREIESRFEVTVDYYFINEFDWTLKQLSNFVQQGFIDYWITSPLLVGGTLGTLIYADMFLTRKGYRLGKVTYFNHVNSGIYELNPRYQEIIHENKPLTWREIRTWVVVIILCMIFSVGTLWRTDPSLPFQILGYCAEIMLGYFVVMFFSVNLNHIETILLFNWVNRHPESIDGHLEVSTDHLYRISRGNAGVSSIFWFSLFVCFGQLFFLGGCLNQIAHRRAFSKWKEKVTLKKEEKTALSKRIPIFAPDRIPKIQSELLVQMQNLDKSDSEVSALIAEFLKRTEDYTTQKMDDSTYIHVLMNFDSFLRKQGIIPLTRYICSSCGEENKLWYKYCTNCGAAHVFCVICGKMNASWHNYCLFCGEKINQGNDETVMDKRRRN